MLHRAIVVPIILILAMNLIITVPLVPAVSAAVGSPPSLDGGGSSIKRCTSAFSCSSVSKTYQANDVLVACESQQNSGAFGISSSPPLTWTTIGSVESVGSAVQLECWWSATPIAQTIVVTASSTAMGNTVVLVQGFKGINETNPLDGSGCGNTGTSSPSACSVTTANANDIIVSAIAVSGSSTLTPTASFSDAFSDSGSPTTNMEYLAVSSPQTGLSTSVGYTKNRDYAQVGWALMAAFPVFGSTINLSNDAFNVNLNDQHALVASGSNVYVTWVENVGVGGTSQVLFRASNDNGATWGPVLNVSTDAGPATLPKVVADGNNAYVVWRDNSTGVPLVYLRASSNEGASFGPVSILSQFASIEPKLAACTGGVFVAWVNSTSRAQAQHSGNPQYTMFFRGSQDGGSTWGPIVNLQSDDSAKANGNEQEIECYGHNVYVVYSDWSPGVRSVFLRASYDLGVTFAPHVAVFVPPKGANIREPVVALGGTPKSNDVYVYYAYRTSGRSNYQSWVVPGWDNGTVWQAPVNLCSDSYNCHEPFMAASGTNVYVVLHEFTSTANTKLYFRVSHDGGLTWSPKVDMIPAGTGKSSFGSISAMGSYVFIGYSNKTKAGNWEMFLTMSSNNGTSFGPTYNLSNNKGASGVFVYGNQERDIWSAGNHVYAMWEDNDTPSGNIGLFFKSVQFSSSWISGTSSSS